MGDNKDKDEDGRNGRDGCEDHDESSESESDDDELEQNGEVVGENEVQLSGADDVNTWDRKYQALLKFYEEKGHCNISQKYKQTMPNGEVISLGRWLHVQRLGKKRGQLTEYKTSRLQALVDEGKLLWDPVETDDKIWNERFSLLCAFARLHKHTDIPKDHIATLSDGSPADLRNLIEVIYKQKSRGTLREDRAHVIERDLIRMGYFQWRRKEDIEDLFLQWENRYKALVKYGDEHGTCNVPENYSCLINGVSVRLGFWLFLQRQDKKSGILHHTRFKLLDMLVDAGKLSWEAPISPPGTTPAAPSADSSKGSGGDEADIWDKKLDALKQFGAEHGHCNVPDVYLATLADGTKTRLGRWLCKQRLHQYKGILKPDREARLQVLVNQGKLRWEGKLGRTANSYILEPTWDEFYPIFLKYRATDGSMNAPKEAVVYVKKTGDDAEKPVEIGQWLHLQRAAFRSGRLHPKCQAQLQALVDAGRLRWLADDLLDQEELWKHLLVAPPLPGGGASTITTTTNNNATTNSKNSSGSNNSSSSGSKASHQPTINISSSGSSIATAASIAATQARQSAAGGSSTAGIRSSTSSGASYISSNYPHAAGTSQQQQQQQQQSRQAAVTYTGTSTSSNNSSIVSVAAAMAASSTSNSNSFTVKNAAVLVAPDDSDDDHSKSNSKRAKTPSSSSAAVSTTATAGAVVPAPASHHLVPGVVGPVIALHAPKSKYYTVSETTRVPLNGVLYVHTAPSSSSGDDTLSAAAGAAAYFKYDVAALFSRPPPLIPTPSSSADKRLLSVKTERMGMKLAAAEIYEHANKKFKTAAVSEGITNV